MRWALLLTRPALIVEGVVAALAVAGLWVHEHDKRVASEALAKSVVAAADVQIKQAEAARDATQDSLREARAATDVARQQATAATASYSAQRVRVDLKAPQPAGTPPGMVLVPISFVQSADSLVTRMQQLADQQRLERAASDRRIAAADSLVTIQATEIVALKAELKAKGAGFQTKVKYAAIGGALAAVAIVVFRR